MLNLDTHVFLYAIAGELTTAEHRLLRANSWSISAIVLWEISKLAQLGRIEIDLDDAEVMRTLLAVRVGRSRPISRSRARDWTSGATRRTN